MKTFNETKLNTTGGFEDLPTFCNFVKRISNFSKGENRPKKKILILMIHTLQTESYFDNRKLSSMNILAAFNKIKTERLG
jgi:hypothetical protein